MREAVESAKSTIHMADLAIEDLVSLIKGRLKKSSGTYRYLNDLKEIKKELQDFDARTLTWKN